MPVVTDYTALLSGNYWNGVEVAGEPVIVTFSFPTTAPAYDPSTPGFTAATTPTFSAFTTAEQAQAIAALGQWAAASGLVFVEVAPGQGDINFQNVDLSTTSYSGAGGVAFYPFGLVNSYSYPGYSTDLTPSGDVFMNKLDQNPADGTVSLDTLLHEIGHAIGLKHPTEVVTDNAPFTADGLPPVVHDQVLSADDPSLTIMSTVGDTGGGAASIKTLDQQAAAYLYGQSGGGVYTAAASGANSVSSWSWDPTTQTLTQHATGLLGETIHGTSVDDIITGTGGSDHLYGLAGNNQLYGGDGGDYLYDGPGNNLLVGGTGNDNYYISNSATQIMENPGEGDDTVYATVSYTLPANVEELNLSGPGLTGQGNNQGDKIFGDGTYASTLIGGTGNDYIVGGAGDDTIEGGGGDDLMYGEGGANHFVFTPANEGPLVSTIGDFTSAQGDKIDLSAITTTGANPGQPLTFIGTSAFGGIAGQVREVVGASSTLLEGDVNGDGAADFEIQLNNVPNLQASDLILTAPQCFLAGTRIATDHGEVAVEHLRVGDLILTAEGTALPLAWLGCTKVSARFADPLRFWPVRIKTGALGPDRPRRDLLLSPDHAVLVGDALIHAGALVNETSVVRERRVPATFVYYHVELERHSLVLAEGALAESFVDNVDRMNFDNWAEHEALYPDGRTIAELPHPRAKARRQVPIGVRAALDRRAEEMGLALSAAS